MGPLDSAAVTVESEEEGIFVVGGHQQRGFHGDAQPVAKACRHMTPRELGLVRDHPSSGSGVRDDLVACEAVFAFKRG